ncbi:probable protein phosphatase 2C 21 [Hordeum vulgare subsp. vulgare]|nr:probable protein phosphatase 2C 21 [Hordeum vulgare subsp. vulgare]
MPPHNASTMVTYVAKQHPGFHCTLSETSLVTAGLLRRATRYWGGSGGRGEGSAASGSPPQEATAYAGAEGRGVASTSGDGKRGDPGRTDIAQFLWPPPLGHSPERGGRRPPPTDEPHRRRPAGRGAWRNGGGGGRGISFTRAVLRTATEQGRARPPARPPARRAWAPPAAARRAGPVARAWAVGSAPAGTESDPTARDAPGRREGKERKGDGGGRGCFICCCACKLCSALHNTTAPLLILRSQGRKERKANPAMDGDATAKCSAGEENDRIKYAASSMRGFRYEMEDALTAVLDLDGCSSTSFFGVYDGHGGADVALYCSRQFHIELIKEPDYRKNLHTALEHVYFRIDEKLKRSDEWKREPAHSPGNSTLKKLLKAALCAVKDRYVPPQHEGTTACVALIRGNQIFVANVGDSRCVLSRNGQANDLSIDHKPDLQHERERIERAGGQVTRDGNPQRDISGRIVRVDVGIHRVGGILAISRAIGDFQFKRNKTLSPAQQIVTCCPDIHTVDITDDAEFLIIASDGIWEAKASQEAVDFVRQRLQSGETDLSVICERLLDSCLGRRMSDNMSVILVQFKASARIRSSPGANPTATAEARADEIKVNIELGGQSSNTNANEEGGQSSNPNANEDDDGSVNGCVGCFSRMDLFDAGEE